MKSKEQAVKIVEKLTQEGYIAYFAGGWVRDLVMGHPSNDIDIATDAPPETIQKLFSRTIPIGAQFGVILVLSGSYQFEVSTFRKDLPYHNGRHPEGVTYSNPQEDAKRRDFTINGLFYDPKKDRILDYVEGKSDIKAKIIRTIGHPSDRFDEDRLRMIRAVRFSSRFGFALDKETEIAIQEKCHTLFPSVAIERVWQELNKMAEKGPFDQSLILMHHLGLLKVIFPEFENLSQDLLKAKVEPFARFPDACPTICYIVSLFLDKGRDEIEKICWKLKVSNREQKLALFLHQKITRLVSLAPISKSDWAEFYAHPDAMLCLEIVSAMKGADGKCFLKENDQRKKELKPHIDRLKEGKPLITGEHLKKYGIAEGKAMGVLLKKAQEIVTNEDISNPEKVIQLLRKEPEWENVDGSI